MLFSCHRFLLVLLWLGHLSGLFCIAACSASGLHGQASRASAPAEVVLELVLPNTAAAKAGLMPGDVVLQYRDRPIHSFAAFGAAIGNVVAQSQVKMTVRRGKRILEVMVNSGDMTSINEEKWIFRPQLPTNILSLYRVGLKRHEAKQWMAASAPWITAFRRAEAASDTQSSAFLCTVISDNYAAFALDNNNFLPQKSKDASIRAALKWAQRLWQIVARGTDREAQAITMMGIAVRNLNLHKLPDAYKCLERAYPLAAACHDEMSMAESLDLRGTIQFVMTTPDGGGAFYMLSMPIHMAKARELFTAAFNIRNRLVPDSVSMGDSYCHMGIIAVYETKIQNALDSYSTARALFQKHAPDSPNMVNCLSDLGTVTAASGKTALARKEYEQALALCRRRYSGAWDTLASLTSSLARIMAMQGNTRKAQFYIQQTLALWRKSSPPTVASRLDLLSTQGLIAAIQGDLESAETHYREGLALANKLAFNSPEKWNLVLLLGLVELARGEFQQCQKHYEEVNAILQFAPASARQAAVLNGLGLTSDSLGNLKQAKDYFQQARAIWKQVLPELPGMVASLTGLAVVALSQKRLTAARQLCEEALVIMKKTGGTFAEAKIQTLLGQILLRQQQPKDALSYFEKATSLLDNQRQAIFSLETRAFLVQQNAEAFTGLMQTYLSLDQPEKAFGVLEHIHARSLVDSMAKRYRDLVYQLPPKFRDQQLALDDRRRVQETELQQAQANHETNREEPLRQSLQALEVQQRQLDADLGLALPRISAIETPQPIDVEAAKQALPPGTLALAFATDDRQTYLFTLTRTRFRSYRLSVSRDLLVRQVTNARRIYANINSTPHKYTPVLKDLYRQLLSPAQEEINHADALVICPDGPLHNVPFAALMPKDGHFLIEKLPVSVVGSLTIYRSLHSARQITNPKVLAVGNPAYRLTGAAKSSAYARVTIMGGTRQQLQETGTVAKQVGKLYAPHSLVLTGEQATISNLTAKCVDVDILHVGCHGLADSRDSLNSSLALTPNSKDTGLLHVWQIMRMRTNAHLVVLWACETGTGAESQFEGVQSVARAFLTAGANNVLMSLWVVQDKPSAELLLDFYRAWKAAKGKKTLAAALREAQIRALKRNPRPYFWATFILNGSGQ